MTATAKAKTYQNYIGGEWRDASGGTTSENRNPARPSEILGHFQSSEVADVERAMDAAHGARDSWRKLSPIARGNILYKASQIIECRADEIGEALTREEGKTFKEGKGETLRASTILRFFAGETAQSIGERLPSSNPTTFLYTERVPLGVVAAITPWNFPIAIPTWKIAPALAYGNTVVFKPAELTPLTATLLVESLAEAGLPPGVLNLVTGSGRRIGDAIVRHPAVNAITFTGSNEVGKALYRQALESERGVKVQLEMGGKNPVIVNRDADLDLALTQTINGAMMSSGQKCTATSRAFVHRAVYDEFVEKLTQRVGRLRLGDPLAATTDLGPLVSATQRDSVMDYIGIGQREGGELLTGGKADDLGDASGAGGDLRAGAGGAAGGRDGGRADAGEQREVWPLRLDLHARYRHRLQLYPRHRCGHHPHQLGDGGGRAARAVRRHEGVQLLLARAGQDGGGVLHPGQDRLLRLGLSDPAGGQGRAGCARLA